jgi:hypothetical protein
MRFVWRWASWYQPWRSLTLHVKPEGLKHFSPVIARTWKPSWTLSAMRQNPLFRSTVTLVSLSWRLREILAPAFRRRVPAAGFGSGVGRSPAAVPP